MRHSISSVPQLPLSVPLNKGNISVPKTKVLIHLVPQDHKSGQAGIVASRQETLLEDLAVGFKPKGRDSNKEASDSRNDLE